MKLSKIKCQGCGTMNVFDIDKFNRGSNFIECRDCKERIFFMVAKTAHIPKDKRSVAEKIYDIFCDDKQYNSNPKNLVNKTINILSENFKDIDIDYDAKIKYIEKSKKELDEAISKFNKDKESIVKQLDKKLRYHKEIYKKGSEMLEAFAGINIAVMNDIEIFKQEYSTVQFGAEQRRHKREIIGGLGIYKQEPKTKIFKIEKNRFVGKEIIDINNIHQFDYGKIMTDRVLCQFTCHDGKMEIGYLSDVDLRNNNIVFIEKGTNVHYDVKSFIMYNVMYKNYIQESKEFVGELAFRDKPNFIQAIKDKKNIVMNIKDKAHLELMLKFAKFNKIEFHDFMEDVNIDELRSLSFAHGDVSGQYGMGGSYDEYQGESIDYLAFYDYTADTFIKWLSYMSDRPLNNENAIIEKMIEDGKDELSSFSGKENRIAQVTRPLIITKDTIHQYNVEKIIKDKVPCILLQGKESKPIEGYLVHSGGKGLCGQDMAGINGIIYGFYMTNVKYNDYLILPDSEKKDNKEHSPIIITKENYKQFNIEKIIADKVKCCFAGIDSPRDDRKLFGNLVGVDENNFGIFNFCNEVGSGWLTGHFYMVGVNEKDYVRVEVLAKSERLEADTRQVVALPHRTGMDKRVKRIFESYIPASITPSFDHMIAFGAIEKQVKEICNEYEYRDRESYADTIQIIIDSIEKIVMPEDLKFLCIPERLISELLKDLNNKIKEMEA